MLPIDETFNRRHGVLPSEIEQRSDEAGLSRRREAFPVSREANLVESTTVHLDVHIYCPPNQEYERYDLDVHGDGRLTFDTGAQCDHESLWRWGRLYDRVRLVGWRSSQGARGR